MKHVSRVEEAFKAATIPSGSRIYCPGNAVTPQVLLKEFYGRVDLKRNNSK